MWVFEGDGEAGKDEQNLGFLHHTFDGLDAIEYLTVTLVVTALVEQALVDGWEYLGLRFQGLPGGDHYILGVDASIEDPSLEVTYP